MDTFVVGEIGYLADLAISFSCANQVASLSTATLYGTLRAFSFPAINHLPSAGMRFNGDFRCAFDWKSSKLDDFASGECAGFVVGCFFAFAALAAGVFDGCFIHGVFVCEIVFESLQS